MMPLVARTVSQLQRSQLSVQALTRVCSIYIFLLSSWVDTEHLALVALQGALLAIPYTLLEALIGRPLAAGLVPAHWNVESWARRAAAATILPVGAIAFLSASIALPHTSPADRLLMIAPVLLQLPLEATFWATAKTRSPQRANLIPQLVAVGTLVGGGAFAALDVRIDVAAVPAQVAVLSWVLLRRSPARSGQIRPNGWQSLKIGSVYCLAAATDLSYSIALPSVAGAIVGEAGVVVLRAMDLAFGPFHVALSAATREDIVAGRKSRLLTGTRGLSVAALIIVSIVVLSSARVRGILADDLASLSAAVVALYCGYKALLMLSTSLSIRHMIWALPRHYLLSAIVSRVVAFVGIGVSILWVTRIPELFLQLLLAEALVVCWFLVRIRVTAKAQSAVASQVGESPSSNGPPGPTPVAPVASGPGS